MNTKLASLGLLVGSLIVTLLLAEMTLRLPDVTYPVFYTHDSDRGGQHRPGVMGWWLKENKSYIRINSDGLPDRVHSTAKPAKVLRIAVLGDSYAEAFQMEPGSCLLGSNGETDRGLRGSFRQTGGSDQFLSFRIRHCQRTDHTAKTYLEIPARSGTACLSDRQRFQ